MGWDRICFEAACKYYRYKLKWYGKEEHSPLVLVGAVSEDDRYFISDAIMFSNFLFLFYVAPVIYGNSKAITVSMQYTDNIVMSCWCVLLMLILGSQKIQLIISF